MNDPRFASWMLEQEARALLTRLALVRPLVLDGPMVPAASLLPEPQLAIEQFLSSGRQHLHGLIHRFLHWLRSWRGQAASPEEAQRRFTILRLRFQRVLTHFDLFDNIIAQRSDAETGVWLSGLDNIAADALRLRGQYFAVPPIVCYLDRGMGAAIRRARTRLPAGGSNPVAIVKIPRERLVGNGIASSLFHEVGHQAAALLGLVESVRRELRRIYEDRADNSAVWRLWERWISEILADVWSVARSGIASTSGLIGVVSLPRPFVFRLNQDDPHPTPYIRVKLSAAFGQAIYPQPAWERLIQLWESYYPGGPLDRSQRQLFADLEASIPELVDVILSHRPEALKGDTLLDALDTEELQPARLRHLLQDWRAAPQHMYDARPLVTFATIGQGRADGTLTPEEESTVITKLLTFWALKSTLLIPSHCANCGLPVRSMAQLQV
ncbi:MAG TPA: hypothetical protein VMB73_34990 [Acetobacteraceae bacterium]|nr:hypothetical protein [Acetobacteraceae bacterium]